MGFEFLAKRLNAELRALRVVRSAQEDDMSVAVVAEDFSRELAEVLGSPCLVVGRGAELDSDPALRAVTPRPADLLLFLLMLKGVLALISDLKREEAARGDGRVAFVGGIADVNLQSGEELGRQDVRE